MISKAFQRHLRDFRVILGIPKVFKRFQLCSKSNPRDFRGLQKYSRSAQEVSGTFQGYFR